MLNLREIEISGFKSFAERTRILLPGDVLVVVGPNGSGKSNVADAVLWSLGEQSAKSLRGKQMQDVIFNGTPKRPPSGQAEVMLCFEDSDGTKVHLGRRLTRSGESTYLIDGRPSRLKDVHEFCHRNAISVQGSYLVEQGRVGDLLKANPEERRLIFEEVAGIAHYKENRRSALQRLEGAQANLLRLQDILSEVETQMVSLKKQASKADRHVRLSEELRARRREHYGRGFAELSGRRGLVGRDLGLFRKEREKREALLATLDSECEGAKHRLAEHEASFTALRESIHQKEIENERREQENRRRAEQILAGRNRVREIEGDLELLGTNLDAARRELARVTGERDTLGATEAEARTRAAEAARATEAARAALETVEGRLASLRKASFDAAQAYGVTQSDLKRTEEDLRKLTEREARIGREQESLRGRIATLEASGQEAESRLAGEEAAAAAARSAREVAEAALAAGRRALDEAVQAVAASSSEAAAQESRLKVLRRQEEARATTAGALLAKAAPGRGGRTLAKVLARAPRALAPALSAVLGELLEGFVDEPWEGLPQALARLRKERAGTALFWLSGAQALRRFPAGVEGAEGFAGWLHEAEGVPSEVRPLLPLAARVATADQARAFAAEHHVAAVSGDGVFVHPDGWVRGGGGGTGAASLFELEQELREAGEALEAARGAREAALDAQGRCQGALEGLQAALQKARVEEEAAFARLAEARAETEKLEGERGRLAELLDLSALERAQAASERQEWEDSRSSLQARLAKLQAAREAAEADLKRAETDQLSARAALDSGHAAVAATSVRMGEVTERVKAADGAVSLAGRRVGELEETARRLAQERERLEQRHLSLQAELTEGDRALRALLLALEEERRRRSGFEETLAALRAELAERERQVREARETLEQTRTEVNRLELAMASAEAELKHVLERIGELFEEPPDVLAQAFAGLPPLTDEERERGHAELVRLEQKITEMGAVNMLAREEYAELDQRFTFLSEQKRDLEQAVASLEETIRKINRTIRDRFMEAFHGVNGHFAHLFRELSEGGEAKLSLLDESNPLETGVEVWAQPPGKKLRVLQLLSGGEKAMVALALLFALFRYRPQPFFILDEANINRFSHLLSQFRHQTQFLIVSHNKRTMELANVLYGVTMVEGGVSRIVSVRMNAVEETGSEAVPGEV